MASEKFLFLHLPKNGGTSLRDMLSSWFPAERTCPYRTDEDYKANFSDADLADYDYFTGHIPAAVAKRFFADEMPKLTVLRNPVDRIYSLYAYWRNYELPEANILDKPEKGAVPELYARELQGPLMAKEHSFGSFLFCDNPYIKRVLTNPQARFLTEKKNLPQLGAMDPQEAVDAILANVETMNITVSTLETPAHLLRTLGELAERFGIEEPVELPHSNKSERVFFEGLDEERVAQYLRLVCPLDFMLYDHFLKQNRAVA